MWSSSLVRAGIVVVALVALAGCSGFRPVYSSAGLTRGDMAFRYSEPDTRLEQIVVQELALRLGRNDDESSPLVIINVSGSSVDLTRVRVVRPAGAYQASVTASYSIVVDGQTVATGSRNASASYTVNSQVMANDAARNDALERAAKEAAQMIRLAILGQLATPTRETALVQ